MNKIFRYIVLLPLLLLLQPLRAQITIGGDTSVVNYQNPKEYTLANVDFEGVSTLDKNILKLITGLSEGDKITISGD